MFAEEKPALVELPVEPFRVYQFATCKVRRFLKYLQATDPHIRRLGQLRRDPHMVGWLRHLAERL